MTVSKLVTKCYSPKMAKQTLIKIILIYFSQNYMDDNKSSTKNIPSYLNFTFSKQADELSERVPMHANSTLNNKQNKENLQYRSQNIFLEHELSKVTSKLNLSYIHAENIEKTKNDLQELTAKQAVVINELKAQIEQKTEKIKVMNEEMQARKNSYEEIIKQLREENSSNKEKISRVVDIVSCLETKIETLNKEGEISLVTQEGLRKRVEQLTQHNEQISRRMAKAEVSSEKYKLKALQGERYWSGKLELLKQKQQESTQLHLKESESKHCDRDAINLSQIYRLNRVLVVKEELIRDLQKRVQQFLISQQ